MNFKRLKLVIDQGLQYLCLHVLPNKCLSCDLLAGEDLALCHPCLARLPMVESVCYQCAAPLHHLDEEFNCRHCQEQALPFDRIIALFQYQMPIINWIYRLKFKHELCYGKVLSQLLWQKMQSEYSNSGLPEVIVPMPLHDKRYRERGFNQVDELLSQLPISAAVIRRDILVRVKATKAQASLARDAKFDNVEGAFKVSNLNNIKYLALVDDVVTTMSTIKSACRALQLAGVENIDVWCVARA